MMMFWPYQLMQDFVHQDYHESIKNKLAHEVRGLLPLSSLQMKRVISSGMDYKVGKLQLSGLESFDPTSKLT